MIENYCNAINNIENFVDALIVVDKECNIVYQKNFCNHKYNFKEKDFIGNKPWNLWPNINKEDSTIYRAVKFDESTYFTPQTIEFIDGQILKILDTTFPLKKENKIIGAVSASIILNVDYNKNFVNDSIIATNRTNDLYQIDDIIGKSELVEKLKYKISKVSKTSSNVFIYGETGSGKELVAQSIHTLSNRKNKPFISQNCAAIPETLLEGIFFGTTKGSYTGSENKPGIFEIADGGTIFLDEINSMNINMQAKLLRAIEEKKITRIGAVESKKVDVRIITAVNQPPHDCVRKNLIREDLFYRLSSILIKVPSLKERKRDIPLLSKYFIDFYNKEMNMNITGVSDEVLQIFNEYDWPGNIRELKNTIECAFNFSSSNVLEKEDLTEYIFESMYSDNNKELDDILEIGLKDDTSLEELLSSFEKQIIINKSKGVRSLAHLADKLNISRQNLNYKMKKHNIDSKSYHF